MRLSDYISAEAIMSRCGVQRLAPFIDSHIITRPGSCSICSDAATADACPAASPAAAAHVATSGSAPTQESGQGKDK